MSGRNRGCSCHQEVIMIYCANFAWHYQREKERIKKKKAINWAHLFSSTTERGAVFSFKCVDWKVFSHQHIVTNISCIRVPACHFLMWFLCSCRKELISPQPGTWQCEGKGRLCSEHCSSKWTFWNKDCTLMAVFFWVAATGDGSWQQIVQAEGHRTNGCLAELLKAVAEWGRTEHHLALLAFWGGSGKAGSDRAFS